MLFFQYASCPYLISYDGGSVHEKQILHTPTWKNSLQQNKRATVTSTTFSRLFWQRQQPDLSRYVKFRGFPIATTKRFIVCSRARRNFSYVGWDYFVNDAVDT